jgi:hypothetical protein
MLPWPEAADSRLLWILFLILLFLAVWVGSFKADPQLEKRKKGERPMMAFEMAGSPEESKKLLDSWKEKDENAYEKFRIALMWDFVFIFLYPAATALACFIATRFLSARGIVDFRYGLALMILQLPAAILDVTENISLLRILRGPIENPWPQIAKWCAIPKFIIVGAGALYALLGGLIWIVTRFKG